MKDTTDLLLKLEKLTNLLSNTISVKVTKLPSNTLLVTLDITSLYTNIPHRKRVAACTTMLNTRGVLQPPTEDLIEPIGLILIQITLLLGYLEERILGRVDKRANILW